MNSIAHLVVVEGLELKAVIMSDEHKAPVLNIEVADEVCVIAPARQMSHQRV